MKKIILFFVLTAVCVQGSSLFQNVRLVWTTNPQSEAKIIWESDSTTTNDFVTIWNESSEKKIFKGTNSKHYTNNPQKKKEKDLEEFNGPWFYRHIPITGLKASTKYRMTVHSNGETGREYHFITAPSDDRVFKLLYVGDSRTRVDVAKKISKQMGVMPKEDSEIIAVIHGGDFANRPSLTCWKPWLEAWDQTTGDDGSLLPIIPVVGNHEAPKHSPMFGEAYGFPGGDNNYLYSCNLSPNFQIAVLNSEIQATGIQEEFVKKTLEAYKNNKVQWQIAAFHRPVYPAIKKPSSLKRFVPLFEEYSIDLVLESDGHCLKRTVPIKNDTEDPNGVVYLGEGGYGAPQRTPKDLWYLKAPGFASQADHLMSLQVHSDKIVYQAVGMDNKVLDTATFQPKKR